LENELTEADLEDILKASTEGIEVDAESEEVDTQKSDPDLTEDTQHQPEGSDDDDSQATGKTVEDTETAEESDDKTDDQEEDQVAESDADDSKIEKPRVFQDIKRDELGEEGQELYDILSASHRNMQADYTKKTQEVADIKKAIDPFDKHLAEIAEAENSSGRAAATFGKQLKTSDVAQILISTSIRQLTDPDARRSQYEALQQEFGTSEKEEETDPSDEGVIHDSEALRELKELKSELNQIKSAQTESTQEKAMAQQFSQDLETFEKAFPDISDEDRELVLATWQEGVGETFVDAAQVIFSQREEIERRAMEIAKERELEQQKVLKSKKSTAPVGAAIGGSSLVVSDDTLKNKDPKDIGPEDLKAYEQALIDTVFTANNS